MREHIGARVVFLGLPAFNEAAAIAPLFDRIRHSRRSIIDSGIAQDLRIVFYDDGSTDATAEAVRANASDLSISLLTPSRNGGLGTALQSMITFFLNMAAESDVLVIMDCDDTHDPRQIAELLMRMDSQAADVVIASRYRKGATISGVPLSRQALSLGFATLVKILLPIRGVLDYSCGYRAYTYSSLKSASQDDVFILEEAGFAAMPEILIRLRRSGLRFSEVPLHLAYDQRVTQSKMRAWNNSTRLIRCLIRWRLSKPSAQPPDNLRDGQVESIRIDELSA